MAPFFLGDNLRTRRPGVRIPHGVPKILEIVRFRGFLFCISCYFRLPLFSDPNADPNGSGKRKVSDSAGENVPHGLGRFQLRVGGNVGIGVQGEACRVMAQHTADGFHVHAVL